MTDQPTTSLILKPYLARYAQELLAHGFKVYLFRHDVDRVANGGKEQVAKSFRYSRVVDDRTCYGSVEEDYFGTVTHTMPIKPSREHGSAMFVGDEESDIADLATATMVASPTNSNRLVGTQQNYNDPTRDRLYIEVTA